MTLLEQYNQRKGAETGKPASASVQKKEAAKKPRTLLESWQQRNLYAQAQDAPRLYSQPSGAQPGDLYAQALQNGGSESAGQKLYEQRRAQAEQANTDFRSNLLNMFGMGLAAQETAGMPDQAELAREQIRSGREAQEANRRSRELNKATDWEGRDELIRQFQEAQALAEYEPSRLNIERATALRKELEQKDEEAGNGARAYGLHDRAQAVIRGAEGNIGSSLVSSFGTLGDNIAAGEMAREAGSVDQALLDLKTGDNTRRAAEAAMRTQEATAGWQRIHDTADKLGGSAAEDLQKAKEGLSALGQMGVDAAENIIEMGFDAGIAMLTNGALTAAGKEIWEGASLASMAMRSFGGAAQEARQDGSTSGEQLLYGLTKAAIEVGTEKLADGVAGIYGKRSADAITEKLIGELAGTNTGRSVLRWLIGALGEGGEEVVSELFAPLAEAIYKDVRFKDFLPFEFEKGEDGGYRLSLTVPKAYQGKAAQILSAFLNGAFVSLISGGAGFVNGQYSNANAELRAQESAARMGEANQNAPQERGAVDVDLEGVLNNEQGIDRGSENRDAGIGAGGQALNYEGGESTGAVDAGNEGGQTGADLQNYVREEVTPAELGISNGSTTAAVRVLDESRFAQGSLEAATAERARQAGLEPVFVLGSMDIGGKQARAYIQGNRVILQADARVTADQLLNHELYHQVSQKDPQLNQTLRESLANNLTEEELGALIDRYIQAYDGVYDFSNMTAEQIGAICEEELFADLYAGIDNTGRTELRESAQQSFERAQTEQSMNQEAEREIRGPTEGRASYAGERARTANSSTLQQAEQMENEGRSTDEIRQETGWFRGMDGQWRFEISDNEAKYYRNGDARFRHDHPEYARYQELMNQFLTGNLSADELVELQGLEQTWGREQARLRGLVESGHATLDMLLDHPALFDAYPQLREARIRFADMESGERGSYNSRTNSFTLSNELRNAPENTLIHEIQHAIQNYEGFSGGSSPEYWEGQERNGRIEGWKSENTKALEKEYTDLMESLPDETRQLIRECNQAYADGDFERIDALEDQLSESPYGGQYFDLMALEGRIANARDADRKVNAQANYINTAGEIEARDVAGRRSMTEEERKNTPPDLGDENTVFAENEQFFSADLSEKGNKKNHGLVLEEIRKHFSEISSDQAVKNITGEEFQKTDNDTRSLKTKIKEYFNSLGNKVTREGFGDIALVNSGVNDSLEHGYGRLKAATFAALPDVLQKGRIYNADPNHILHPYDSYLIVAPVNVGTDENTERCYVGAIVMRDVNTQRYKIHEVLTEKANGTSSDKSEAHQLGSGLRYDVPSKTIIHDSYVNSNPQNEGKASATVTPNHTEEQRTKERENERRTNQSTADSLADGAFRGIDIMPEEGEEAVSSASGLTEEDNRRLDRGFPASDLFGPTNAAKERAATDRAIKEGNEALLKFAEEMPEDPMDLYGEQNPVSSRKGSGGDDGGDNGNRHVSGQEKISTAKDGEKKTLRQKVSDAWHRFLRSMVNEGDAIHQIGRKTGNKAIDGMYFYAKAATMRAQQWIQKQRTSFDTKTTGKSLNAIFDPIRAKGDAYYEKFQLYLYHMLNAERMSRSTEDVRQEAQRTLNRLAAVNPDIAAMTDETLAAKARQYQEGGGLGYDTENGELIYEYWKAKQDLKRAEKAGNKPVFSYDMSAEESRQTARDLLAENPEFEELAQEVYDYCDALLQYRVYAGLISAEDMAQLKKTYPHYVPVMYEMAEDASDKVRKGNVSVSSTVKSAKGGTTKMLPLHYALARQTLAVMRNAGYQQLGSAVLNEYEKNGEIMGRYVKDVSENEAVWDESMADNDDVNVPYENVISVFKDGKRYDITLSDDLSYAFQSLNPGKNGSQDLKAAMAANNLFKKLCTAYNPLFMITNPIRDVQDALFYSTDTKRWIKNYPKAIAQIAGSGQYWQMYQSLGGVQNSYFDWATGETAGNMGKVEALNMAIEQAPRLAEFMTVLENAQRDHGNITQEDLMEAFNAAAEITTNFSRGGTMGKWINRNLVPFWNPGVQGLSKAVRTATETKGFKAWAGLALKAAALGMLPEFLNGLLYKDDEEWDVIDDQMKMDYYLFKTSDGVWIKVPKGRMLAALSMPVVGAQEAARGDDVDWGGLAKSAFGSVAPNNPFETNLLSTALQAKLTNPDDPGKTWYGGNIESKRLQSYAPGERYDESTDYISKWLGGKLGISPKKLNYVIDQYSGILGDLILPYLTPKAERGLYVGGFALPLSNAFMSRFTTDTVTSNTISQEYYGLLDELGYAAKGGDKPSAIAERYMNRAGGKVTEMYAKIREIENDKNLSDAEKSKLTRELRKQLNEYEQQVTADAGEYLATAQKYMDDHPEFDYADDKAVDAYVEGYNSMQSAEKCYIDADQAKSKMKDEVYREVNREHFGAEYALQVYNKDTYAKAQGLNESCGLSYDDYYDYYFGTRYLYADKDEDGKSISGSKKEKIVAFISEMDITDEQKDALYMAAGYTEKSLNTTPWHNGSGKYSSGKRSGGGRSGKSSAARSRGNGTGSAAKKGSIASGIDIRELFGGTGRAKNTDAGAALVEIIDKYYGGNALAAAIDGGRKAKKGRTKVDFRAKV